MSDPDDDENCGCCCGCFIVLVIFGLVLGLITMNHRLSNLEKQVVPQSTK